MSTAVIVSDLRKSYGELEALRGVTFEIAAGEIFDARDFLRSLSPAHLSIEI